MNKTLIWHDRLRHTNGPPTNLFDSVKKIFLLVVIVGISGILFVQLNEKNSSAVDLKNSSTDILFKQGSGFANSGVNKPVINSQKTFIVTAALSMEDQVISPSELLEDLMLVHNKENALALMSEDIKEIQDLLQKLIDYGPDSIADIRKFLKSGDDILFEQKVRTNGFNYPSLRLALIDLLSQFGDAEEVELAWAEALNGNLNPMEIEAVSKHLLDLAPDYYQQSIIDAALAAIHSADDGGLNGQNIGPLFKVVQQFNAEEVLTMLEETRPLWWGQYASLALANLPEGKGIPNLVAFTKDSDFSRDLHSRFALKMLAQAAPEYTSAADALIEIVRNNNIPNAQWADIASLVAGLQQFQIEDVYINTYSTAENYIAPLSVIRHIAYTPGGNQNLISVRYSPNVYSEEQREQSLILIDDLLSETSNPVAIRALEDMLGILLPNNQ